MTCSKNAEWPAKPWQHPQTGSEMRVVCWAMKTLST